MKRITLAFAATLLASTLAARPQHSEPSPAPPAHHACLEAERQALENGEGFGMALAADRQGFPGPKHILDLREELALTPEQEKKVQLLFDHMRAQALAKGTEILAKEAELEALFASGVPETEKVRRLVKDSAALRADLRLIHLEAHLAAYAVLAPEARARYHELRYAEPTHPH